MIRPARHTIVLRLLAVALQLCMALLPVSALLHSEDDDVLCNPVVVLHDHNAHHVGDAGAQSPAPEHCFICHNLSLRSLVETARSVQPAPSAEALVAESGLAAGIRLDTRQPARAPPLA